MVWDSGAGLVRGKSFSRFEDCRGLRRASFLDGRRSIQQITQTEKMDVNGKDVGTARMAWENDFVDRGSILRVWLPLVAGLFVLGFIFLAWPGPRGLTRWIGLGLSLVGLGGVMLARYTLGRSFSIRAKATELVTSGIYSRIRNPIYVFGMIFFAGEVLIIRLPVLLLLLVIIVPMQIVRARREARVLEDKFGDAYRRYREATWF